MPGLPFIGKSSLAKTLVKGSSLVPSPANGIIACLIIQMFYLLILLLQMKLIKQIIDLNKAIKKEKELGFVPTMGSLHKGHKLLIKISKKKCKKTLVSIFVNPTQFNNKDDYKT